MSTKFRQFWQKNETKIVLLIGFSLISVISFEFGVLKGSKWQSKPLVIESLASEAAQAKTASSEPSKIPGVNSATPNLPTEVKNVKNNDSRPNSNQCPYVGSKNSTKFYLANCSWAKQIKSENLVCFQTAEEALAQGRTESKCN